MDFPLFFLTARSQKGKWRRHLKRRTITHLLRTQMRPPPRPKRTRPDRWTGRKGCQSGLCMTILSQKKTNCLSKLVSFCTKVMVVGIDVFQIYRLLSLVSLVCQAFFLLNWFTFLTWNAVHSSSCHIKYMFRIKRDINTKELIDSFRYSWIKYSILLR